MLACLLIFRSIIILSYGSQWNPLDQQSKTNYIFMSSNFKTICPLVMCPSILRTNTYIRGWLWFWHGFSNVVLFIWVFMPLCRWTLDREKTHHVTWKEKRYQLCVNIHITVQTENWMAGVHKIANCPVSCLIQYKWSWSDSFFYS